MNFVPVFKRFNLSRILAQLRFLIHEEFNRRMRVIDSFFAIWVPVKGASQNKGIAESREPRGDMLIQFKARDPGGAVFLSLAMKTGVDGVSVIVK